MGLLTERPSRTHDDDIERPAPRHGILREPLRSADLPACGGFGIPMLQVSSEQLPHVVVPNDQEDVQAREIEAVGLDAMLLGHGEAHHEREDGTLSGRALHLDRTIHHRGQALYNREPQSRAFLLFAFYLTEIIEDEGQIASGDTGTRINDG